MTASRIGLIAAPALIAGAFALSQHNASAAGPAGDPNGRQAEPHHALRCGTPDLTRAQADDVEREADVLFERFGHAQRADTVTVPIAFHVISKGDTERDGNVPDSMIADQIAVMNESYAPWGIQFELSSVDRTVNRSWYNMSPGSPSEKEAKSTLNVDPTTHFNVYTASPGLGLLGWATFPWTLRFQTDQDGVVILNSSMPGGSINGYNEGDTLVHEAGHWLGLYHTFQGGCRGGDEVDDTAPEASATSGCPTNKDTCTGDGPDPIENFMDYSYDSCMFEFTPGQGDRMNMISGLFRRGIF